MIGSSTQLKDKVKNYSLGDSWKAQSLIRNFMMERFLERCSKSFYRDYFVLKGGMLVSSMIGIKKRATMDIDATVQNYPLTLDKAKKMVEEIISIPCADQVVFTVQSVAEIMEEHDYPGIRFVLVAHMDKLRQPIKVDISTGDIITPKAVIYKYPLMFENRSICILSYSLETVLAEKLETIIRRGVANTRMRDFYDIVVLMTTQEHRIEESTLQEAYKRTAENRKNTMKYLDGLVVLHSIRENSMMQERWKHYQNSNFYAQEITWNYVLQEIEMVWRNIWKSSHLTDKTIL